MLLVSMVTGIEISPLTVNLNPPFVYFFDAYLEGEAGRHSVTTATQTSHLKEESPKRNLLPPPPDLLQLIVPPVSDRAGTTEGHVWGFSALDLENSATETSSAEPAARLTTSRVHRWAAGYFITMVTHFPTNLRALLLKPGKAAHAAASLTWWAFLNERRCSWVAPVMDIYCFCLDKLIL